MKLHSERLFSPIFARNMIAAAAFALSSGYAMAVEPFTIKDIRIEGIQRTEPGTVFSYLPVRVGDTYTDEKGIEAIKALFATGFFKDVKLEVQGNVLVVVVDERPAIAKIEYKGIKEFDKDQIAKSLKELGLGESRIFDRSLLERSEQELKRQYLSRGYYAVDVKATVTPIARNRVNIDISVDEGNAAHIKQINIVGNKAFSDKELHEALSLTNSGWFTWYTKADQYSKQKLTGDLEALRSFYLNRGYIEMQVESTQVAISPDKKSIYITINITEGKKYKVSGVKLEGETFGREAELKSLVTVKPGDVYNGEQMTDSVKRISDRLGNFGYAFANVNANPDINREKNEVALTIMIDPGKRVYVRRINIVGNTTTRDEVIRREFRQFEDSWYDGDRIKRSRDRVERLGYFKDVTIETPEVPGTNDQVDVSLNVTENQTGSISVGGGYSSSEKLIFTAQYQQANAFGSGDSLGIEVNTSRLYRTLAISHTDPYFTDDGVSRSIQLYSRTTRPPLINTGDYRVKTIGGGLQFGVPFSEYDTVFFGIAGERTTVETFLNSPLIYQQYVKNFGDGVTATTNSVPLTVAWQRDSRNNVLTPTEGRYQRVNLEAAPAGDMLYYRGIFQQQLYQPLTSWATFAVNGEFDYGHGLRGKPYPVFKNFYAGGIGTVRGYADASLGPLAINQDPLGGSKRLIGNAELQFSFPGAGKDKSLRWFTFLDGGDVFAEGQKIRPSELRYSAGVGISWISPIGPLRLSYGMPLNAKPSDRKDRLQFTVGTGF